MSNNSFMTMTRQLTTKILFAPANRHVLVVHCRNALVTMQECLAVAIVVMDQAESSIRIM